MRGLRVNPIQQTVPQTVHNSNASYRWKWQAICTHDPRAACKPSPNRTHPSTTVSAVLLKSFIFPEREIPFHAARSFTFDRGTEPQPGHIYKRIWVSRFSFVSRKHLGKKILLKTPILERDIGCHVTRIQRRSQIDIWCRFASASTPRQGNA